MTDAKTEVFPAVQETLAEALGVDEEDVTMDSTLIGDLGAESIDFLDIIFRLEKRFSLNIPREELFPEDILMNAEYVTNGDLTADGLALLKERMPFADLSALEDNPRVANFGDLITTRTICNYVESRLG